MAYAGQEYSYEKSFSDYHKIFRVGVDFMNMGGFAVGPEYLPEYLSTHSETMESFCRISPRGQIEVEDGPQSASPIVIACDSTFLKLFDSPGLFY